MTEVLPSSPANTDPSLALPYNRSVSERNAWLDSQLNPDGSLPAVTVDHQWYVRRQEYDFDVFDPAGEPIGFVSLNPPTREDPFASVSSVQLHQSTKGKSFGPAAYLGVMKRLPFGAGLRSGITLTEGSYKLWRNLEAAGVAVCDKTPDESHPQVGGKTDGLYTDVHFQTVFGGWPSVESPAESDETVSRGGRLAGLLHLGRARK